MAIQVKAHYRTCGGKKKKVRAHLRKPTGKRKQLNKRVSSRKGFSGDGAGYKRKKDEAAQERRYADRTSSGSSLPKSVAEPKRFGLRPSPATAFRKSVKKSIARNKAKTSGKRRKGAHKPVRLEKAPWLR